MLIVSLAALSLAGGILFQSQKQGEAGNKGNAEFRSSYAVTQVPLPDTLSLAGEKVPLDIWYVRESLDRELLVNVYWQSNTLLMIKRSARYLPEIKKIFREMGVPEDLAYLSLVESGLTGAVSPAGAEGYWQFITATGKSYGLEISDEVDERYHMAKATRAAALYLKAARNRFNSWTMAAAAYNRGMDGLAKATEQQGEGNFYDLWLNQETTRYIYRLLAIKLIIDKPMDFGFYLRPHDLYPPLVCDTIKVDTLVSDLPALARDYGISFRTLKEYNPWIRKYSLKATGKGYELLIPSKGSLTLPMSGAKRDDTSFFNGEY